MIDSHELLSLSERLARDTCEADWRAAISRAYYSAFHHARELFQALGFDVPRSDAAHAFFWRRMENSGHAALKSAGSALVQLGVNAIEPTTTFMRPSFNETPSPQSLAPQRPSI